MIIKKTMVLSAVLIMAGLLAVNATEIRQKPIKNNKTSAPIEAKATFVELGSVNCIPCKMMQPVIKEIEEKYTGQVKVVFYDVWKEENKPYAEKYKVQAIPTQVFLDKDGKEFARHIGFFPKEEIDKVLEKQGIKPFTKSTKSSIKSGSSDSTMKSGEVCK